MARRAIGLLTVFILSSPAYDGAIVELVPDDPGPYYGGESLTVDFWLHNEDPFDFELNSVEFDFADANSPEAGNFHFLLRRQAVIGV